MHISNVRLGFATNSSSTHSIIFCKKDSPKKFRDFEAFGGDFGWNEFCCASADAKALYLAQTLFNTLSGMIGDDMARSVAADWCHTVPSIKGYVDHQSQMSLPVSRKAVGYGHDDFYPIDRVFFDELMAYYMREDLVIVGGNDNSEHTRFQSDRQHHILPTDEGNGAYICKKDGDWWVLMNRNSGAKIRLSFKDKPKPYVKSSTPELVDVKITNYCPYGCEYCYQDSTETGTHGEKDFIEDVCRSLDSMEVFEVALGGGETTLHPHFANILRDFKNHGIVPNFTTRNPNWIKNDAIREAVRDTSGRFAYSIDNVMDMYRVYMNIESSGLLRSENCRGHRRLAFQFVMGAGTENQFQECVKASSKLGCDLTLLGYKDVGRGKTYRHWDYKNWYEILKNMRAKGEFYGRVGIDTCLAQQSQKELEKDGLGTLVTYDEGAFSMYIDAVEKKMGPSSFCNEDEYVPLAPSSNTYGSDTENQIRAAYKSFGKKVSVVADTKKKTQGV